MPDQHSTDTASSHLDALESELAAGDPAEAPAIAEEIASMLSDSLDATQAGTATTDAAPPSEGGTVGESRS